MADDELQDGRELLEERIIEKMKKAADCYHTLRLYKEDSVNHDWERWRKLSSNAKGIFLDNTVEYVSQVYKFIGLATELKQMRKDYHTTFDIQLDPGIRKLIIETWRTAQEYKLIMINAHRETIERMRRIARL